MVQLSKDLTWLLVKDNNCFLQKRNGKTPRSGFITMSAEPLNLTNKNSFKASGLANTRAVGIEEGKDFKGNSVAFLQLKASCIFGGGASKPKLAVGATLLKKCWRSGANTVTKQVEGTYYRPDLTGAALTRWSKIHRSIRTAGGHKKPMIVKAGRSSKSA
ncbi:unnamed protein product [Phaeothamnion confervicola]